MAALWRWIGSFVYSFGPHGGLRDSICEANVVPEGALETLRELLGGMWHLLGAGPILDPFSEKMLQNLEFYTVWEPARVQKNNEADEPDEAEMMLSRQSRPQVLRA